MNKVPSFGTRSFVKMHGLGNDFAIFDARRQSLDLVAEQVRLLCDRRLGIGCDQLVVIEAADNADAFVRFYNADGSMSGACGNGTRCVAALLFAEKPRDTLTLATQGGMLTAWSDTNGMVRVDMGKPRFDWREIPLAQELDTAVLPIKAGKLINPTAVSMGNPHMVFFADADADADINLEALGPELERHPLFPERANVSLARVLDRGHIRLDVWERGAGLTLACGTAACASVVAASLRGLIDRRAEVRLPGGTLSIEWGDDDHVHMTGAVAVSFMGMVEVPAMAGLS